MKPFLFPFVKDRMIDLFSVHRRGGNRNPLGVHVWPIPVRMWVKR